ncbi:hypothetical protein EYZ11_010895 [Aspergillus tanneri]|uniref:Thymus-specific serine protease n=1 Tax=Aspergillus tanneri TaxID=1220188 RepID=A0A4S3J485_9EURO|nr:hypothetical protein EYZ11_010895 [Aspergillus tanneri]
MYLRTTLTVPCLALLSSSVLGIGLQQSALMREFQLAAELGLDPSRYLNDRSAFHNLISHGPKKEPTFPAEYVEYFVPGGPIILYDVGEANAQSIAQTHLSSNLSFFGELLQDFKAMGIVWEHRYYGESCPFPVHNDTPAEHLKYLNTDQALQDIPHFAKTFSRLSHSEIDLTPRSTPWVMVGCSYAGNRAALTRNEYPDTIFAAFASSAPVQARVDMSMYWDQVYRGMVYNGLGNCTKDLNAALKFIDHQLADPQTSAWVKRLFLGPGADQNSNEDFTSALTSLFGFFQSSGTAGTSTGSLEEFCNYLEVDPKTKQTAGPQGLAPTHGSRYIAERWASWPMFIPLVNLNSGTNCNKTDHSLPLSCALDQPITKPDSISWSWQYCTEWGFFQSNNFGPHSLLSRYQTLEYQQEVCNRQFPGMLPLHPQAEALNEQFGGWDIRPPNVYFSGGEFDPWRTLSTLSSEHIAPQDMTWSSEIPKCGVTQDETIFGHVLPNSMHCFDFQILSTPGKTSRALFTTALREWLQCFQQRGLGGESDENDEK